MRKYYIDNIRILCILLLIPYHTAMIFNNFGESWYVHSKGTTIANLFLGGVYPWWMSTLFVLAGISTAYALRKRTVKQYVRERVFKLLIPLMSAIILLIPVQTFIADIYFRHYRGSYFEHLTKFFTITDLSGYDGHFTPGHTWFILYLFIISMVSLPLIVWYKNRENKLKGDRISMIMLLPMFIVIFLCTPILNIGGKSLGEFTVCYLLGYFVLSLEEVQERLAACRILLGILWAVLFLLSLVMYRESTAEGLLWNIEQKMFSWFGVLAILALGKRFLEFNSSFTKYFTAAAFPIYFFHQSIVVVTGYFVVNRIQSILLQYIMIAGISFVFTVTAYEICRRIMITRFLFGIKKG